MRRYGLILNVIVTETTGRIQWQRINISLKRPNDARPPLYSSAYPLENVYAKCKQTSDEEKWNAFKITGPLLLPERARE